jgi:glycosyltransferase involved in cell wall biosynthesis
LKSDARPRLLLLTMRDPWADHGGDRLRARRLAEQLAKRFDVIVWHPEPQGAAPIEPLPEGVNVRGFGLEGSPARALLRAASNPKLPLQVALYDHAALHRACALEAPKADIVVAHLIRMAPYLAHFGQQVRVLDYCDAVSENARQTAQRAGVLSPWGWLNRIEAPRARHFERAASVTADLALVSSQTDQQWMGLPDDRTLIVPQGVDTRLAPAAPPTSGEKVLLVIGQMDYFPNLDGVLWFAREVLPQLAGVTLRVAGRISGPRRAQLAALDGVQVHGRFGAIAEVADGCILAIAPLHVSTGVQNKVLEYLAVGLPVVASPAAVRGLPTDAEPTGIQVAGDAAQWVSTLHALIDDAPRRDALRTRGLAHVRLWHDWDAIGARLTDRITELLAKHQQRSLPSVA